MAPGQCLTLTGMQRDEAGMRAGQPPSLLHLHSSAQGRARGPCLRASGAALGVVLGDQRAAGPGRPLPLPPEAAVCGGGPQEAGLGQELRQLLSEPPWLPCVKRHL